jgi:hypothetical protein
MGRIAGTLDADRRDGVGGELPVLLQGFQGIGYLLVQMVSQGSAFI